jgi:hypothetical protein
LELEPYRSAEHFIDAATKHNIRPAPLLPFDQQKQQLLEYLEFENEQTFKEMALGSGTLKWAGFPVELADGPEGPLLLYSDVIHSLHLGVRNSTGMVVLKDTSVLVYPIELENAMLYVLESESHRNAQIDLTDPTSGVELKLQLPAQHAALALIDKKTKQIAAKYGF